MLTFKRLRERQEVALEQVDTQPETVTETVEVVETSEASESLETVVDAPTPQETSEQVDTQPETVTEVQNESPQVPAPESTPKRRK
jgi:hypothetical protein